MNLLSICPPSSVVTQVKFELLWLTDALTVKLVVYCISEIRWALCKSAWVSLAKEFYSINMH